MRGPALPLLLAALCGAPSAAMLATTFNCAEMKCVPAAGTTGAYAFSECKALCERSLWPFPSEELTYPAAPTAVEVSNAAPVFDVTAVPAGAAALMGEMTGLFAAYVTALPSTTGAALRVTITVTQESVELDLDTDEGYTMTTANEAVAIEAATVFGARHALETLTQMIFQNENTKKWAVPGAATTIRDKPKYAYRGVQVDTSRNFITVPKLQELIRGMAMTKLNSLHLHLVDTAAFPIEIKKRPRMAQTGAYSAEQTYTQEVLAALRAYALRHGVRLIPEIDQPGHAREGWLWGEEEGLGALTVCTGPETPWWNSAFEPPAGQLNPLNENVHTIMKDIYDEVTESMGSSVFHMGGDEVVVQASWNSCWNDSVKAKVLVDMLDQQGRNRSDPDTFYGLWKDFTKKSVKNLRDVFTAKGKKLDKVMQWAGEEGGWNLVREKRDTATFPTDLFMFQMWDGFEESIAPKLMNEGYDVVLSNNDLFYLDCGKSAWVRDGSYWCKYNSWYRIYDSTMTALDAWKGRVEAGAESRLRGAEVTMWTETFSNEDIVQAIFPRASALGERLWSNPATGWYDADPRFQHFRHTMARRGINAAALQPEWCLQKGAYSCTLKPSPPPEPTPEPTPVPPCVCDTPAPVVGGAVGTDDSDDCNGFVAWPFLVGMAVGAVVAGGVTFAYMHSKLKAAQRVKFGDASVVMEEQQYSSGSDGHYKASSL